MLKSDPPYWDETYARSWFFIRTHAISSTTNLYILWDGVTYNIRVYYSPYIFKRSTYAPEPLRFLNELAYIYHAICPKWQILCVLRHLSKDSYLIEIYQHYSETNHQKQLVYARWRVGVCLGGNTVSGDITHWRINLRLIFFFSFFNIYFFFFFLKKQKSFIVFFFFCGF